VSAAATLANVAMAAPPVELSDVAAGQGGFVIRGADSNDQSGASVAGAGDVNGDGLRDLIIGAYLADASGNVQAGESYIVFGKADTAAIELADVANGIGGFVIRGDDAHTWLGFDVSAAGDVNGDGLADVILGAPYSGPAMPDAPSESFIVFGKVDTAEVLLADLASGTGGFVIRGANHGELTGMSVSRAGDVNNDGLADFIIGAPEADANGPCSGESYVVFGKVDTAPVDLQADVIDGDGGFVIRGVDADDRSGEHVARAGDVNGDGFGDLFVGAPEAAPDGVFRGGMCYVVFGKTGSDDVELADIVAGQGGFSIVSGWGGQLYVGSSLGGGGDVNGDGLDDVLIGLPFRDANGEPDSGESFVVFGKVDGAPISLREDVVHGLGGFNIRGTDRFEESGASVSSAGDVNGDGLRDLIVGAWKASPGGNVAAGRGYVVYGSAGGERVELADVATGLGGFVINGTNGSEYAGSSVSGAGDVNGDGLGDLLVGVPWADPGGRALAGETYVIWGTDAVPPNAPQDCSASDGAFMARVRITWSETEGAASYQVFRRIVGGEGGWSHVRTTTNTAWNDHHAELGTTYRYFVRAVNENGPSSKSNTDTGYVQEVAPQAPEDLTASDGEYTERIRVRWKETAGADLYRVYRRRVGTSGWELVKTTTDRKWNDRTAEANVNYKYYVKAVNDAGQSPRSNVDVGWMASE
jgi:hypothetical protein